MNRISKSELALMARILDQQGRQNILIDSFMEWQTTKEKR